MPDNTVISNNQQYLYDTCMAILLRKCGPDLALKKKKT